MPDFELDPHAHQPGNGSGSNHVAAALGGAHSPAGNPGTAPHRATNFGSGSHSASPSPNGPTSWPILRPGAPVSTGPMTVFPIEGIPDHSPDYILLADAIKHELARVQEVDKGGQVPLLMLDSRADLPILAIQGEELIGAKQNRTLNVSILAGRGKTEIPVTCIERGRWAYNSRNFGAGGFEHYMLRRKKAAMVSSSRKLRRPAHRRVESYAADQGAVWQEVDHQLASHQVASPTASLSDLYSNDRVSSMLDRFDVGMKLPATTRGVVVAFGDQVVSAEIFECPKVFAKLWPRILRSYAVTAMNQMAVRETQGEGPGKDQAGKNGGPTLEQAEAFLLGPCNVEGKSEESVGLGQDVRWETDGFLACSLFHEGRMLHGTVYGRA